MVLKNKDQKKSSSKISDDDSSNDDDRHTISISSKDSIEPESQMADPDAFSSKEEGDGSFIIVDTVDVEPTFDDAEHVEHDDYSSSDAEKENDSLPAPAAQQVNLDESTHGEGSVLEGNEEAESVKLKDDTSCASKASAAQDESRSTLSQSQRIDQTSYLKNQNEENAFVPGAAVHIIKGTNKGKCGIISRVTDKCVFISISGLDKDVRKTKSNEFLQFSNQTTTTKQHHSGPQEIFLQGNSVLIKKGLHRGCQGIISRTTEKCVFISIEGFSKDVRKKKSVAFLQLLNDNANYELQGIDDQVCAAEAEETSEVNVFDVGRQVRVIKGNHLGKCGVISRVTNKSVFISIEGMSKDIRKSKSDKFLQIMQPSENLLTMRARCIAIYV